MFELKGPGVCEMLDKLQSNSDQSCLRSNLTKHKQVIEVASHDLVYVNSIADLTKVEASPFSGTPHKYRSRTTTELPSKQLTFESIEPLGNCSVLLTPEMTILTSARPLKLSKI